MPQIVPELRWPIEFSHKSKVVRVELVLSVPDSPRAPLSPIGLFCKSTVVRDELALRTSEIARRPLNQIELVLNTLDSSLAPIELIDTFKVVTVELVLSALDSARGSLSPVELYPESKMVKVELLLSA